MQIARSVIVLPSAAIARRGRACRSGNVVKIIAKALAETFTKTRVKTWPRAARDTPPGFAIRIFKSPFRLITLRYPTIMLSRVFSRVLSRLIDCPGDALRRGAPPIRNRGTVSRLMPQPRARHRGPFRRDIDRSSICPTSPRDKARISQISRQPKRDGPSSYFLVTRM
jgi:hypothetical protein